MKCLEKDPEKRYPSAEALAEDLERFLRADAIEARPSGVISKFRRWARREPALVSRLAGVLATATIVQIRYFFAEDITADYHYRIMSLFAVCAAMAFLFQRMMHNDSLAQPARFGWAASDVLILTSLLYLSDLPIGAILIGYPLLIAAAGLFFLVRLVLFTTVLSLCSFAVLLMIRPEILKHDRPHYLLIFAAVLAVQGLITAHQVYRVRALSRYYEQRRV
jgi:serine/threonine-protein kinase